jgi:hypothetical protein
VTVAPAIGCASRVTSRPVKVTWLSSIRNAVVDEEKFTTSLATTA